MSDNYYLLDDMEKYQEGFNRKAYEHLTIKETIPIFKDYYDKHLPIDVTTWIRVNTPSDNLIYKDGQGNQIVFIRDTIIRNMFYKGEYDSKKYDECQPKVISTHRSKSVLLPVMEIDLLEYGIRLTFRNNFYNWNVSVESEQEVVFDHKGIINDESYHYCFCEGFPNDKIFGKYEDNKKKFTICIDDDYNLYIFMFLLKDWLVNR